MPSLLKNKSAGPSVKNKIKKAIGKIGVAKNGVTTAAKNGVKAGKKTVLAKATQVANAVKAAAGKRTYFFGDGKADGNKEMKNLLGGKGANLAEMANIGLPVPPGFTITTEVCTEFYANGKKLPKQLDADVRAMIARMEKQVGAKFGDPSNPLLVSVRSGARVSMPGMMDTILNLGLNDTTAAGLAAKSGNERFACDSYRRFVAMYGDVVLGLKPENKEDHDPFDDILAKKKKALGVKVDSDLPADALKELVAEFKAEIKSRLGIDFPNDPYDAARRRHQGGLPVVAERPRESLPPPEQHPGGVGHGRQRPGDGVRQQGRRLGDRRLLHPRSRPAARTCSTASS